MNSELQKLIIEYLDKVEFAYQSMLKGMNFLPADSSLAWRASFPPLKGEFELNGNNSFVLHGIGCDFKNKDFEISWDFGRDGNRKGIEPWFFLNYLNDNNRNPDGMFNIDIIKSEFNEAVLSGLMFKRDALFYYKVHKPRKRGLSQNRA
jgi:hypothetical protein